MLVSPEKIMEAKVKLGDAGFDSIMKFLGVEDYDTRHLKCSCPHHSDSTPSMIWNPKEYYVKCFGCGVHYDYIDACMYALHKTFVEACQMLFEEADIKYSFGEYGVQTRRQYRYPTEVPVNGKEKVYAYLARRHISQKTADHLDIREDDRGNLVFNYYDSADVLTMVKYRPSRKVNKGEAKNWCQKDADTTPLLFNMNRCNPSQPLVITCGELDCASVIESGYQNVVSIPLGDQNFAWIEECLDWLEQFSSIIVFHDNDEAGTKFIKEVVPRLGSWRCKIADCPEFVELPNGNKKHIKDVNEALFFFGKEEVMNLILSAKDSPVPSVVDFSDIEDKEFSDLEGITTGLVSLDKEIMCLPYGSLTILSGQPGSGKTSILYGLVCQALEQGTNAWVFSRELPDYTTKGWLNYMWAGPRHVNEYRNSRGAIYYKVKPEIKKEISDYYNGRLYIYRDDYGCTAAELLDSMKDSVRKYGTRFILIDSLMMVDLQANENNKNEKQTEFVNQLIAFAMRYSVAIVLVCHPRKMQSGQQEVGMYDIAGSSNIINLGHRALGLRRVSKKEQAGEADAFGGWSKEPCPYNCILTIIKDRFRGRSGSDVGLFYDEASRRFFTTPEEYDYHYEWDPRTYEEEIPYPVEDMTSEVFGTMRPSPRRS